MELSKKALIECAKICAGSGNCADCDFCAEDECDRALLKALASALEEVAFSEVDDGDRLTARENGHAYFVKCFEEPCLGGGCENENCEFMQLVCEKLCKYEEGARAYGIEWIPCKLAKPVEDDEYLVMIAGAKKTTVLHYDPTEEMFYEEDCDFEPVYYPVTHWAELPTGPAGVICESTDKPDKRVKRCATCAHEDKLGDEARCLECEKHNLWEERK